MQDKTLDTLRHNAQRVADRQADMDDAFDAERQAAQALLKAAVDSVLPALPAICQTPVSGGGEREIMVVELFPAARGEPALYLAVGGAFLRAVPPELDRTLGAMTPKLERAMELAPLQRGPDDDPYGCYGVVTSWKPRIVSRILRELALRLDQQLGGRSHRTVPDRARARANKIHAILTLLDG